MPVVYALVDYGDYDFVSAGGGGFAPRAFDAERGLASFGARAFYFICVRPLLRQPRVVRHGCLVDFVIRLRVFYRRVAGRRFEHLFRRHGIRDEQRYSRAFLRVCGECARRAPCLRFCQRRRKIPAFRDGHAGDTRSGGVSRRKRPCRAFALFRAGQLYEYASLGECLSAFRGERRA